MQIASFTRNADGVLVGRIKTLTLDVEARFVPADASDNEKAPALRLIVGGQDVGAGWARTSREDRPFHSVKLDDISLPAPVYCSLVEQSGGSFALIWSR